jgi:hypothetical protein
VTRRVFLNVRRGMTDATAVCVFPWEKKLLEHIHGQEVAEVTIDQMASVKDGVVKKEKVKFKYDGMPGPDLRQQLEAMAYVDPEEDPANDPAAEYGRLADKYGADASFDMSVVERVYGRFDSGGFEQMLKSHLKDRAPMPSHLKAQGEGLDKSPAQMNVGELRQALQERGIKFKVTESRDALAEKLEGALVE